MQIQQLKTCKTHNRIDNFLKIIFNINFIDKNHFSKVKHLQFVEQLEVIKNRFLKKE